MNEGGMVKDKILKDESFLPQWVGEVRAKKKSIVLCQGHFNVIHPGHLRFLEYASKQGDRLIVAVHGENKLEPIGRRKFFNVEERVRCVASLEYVDCVFIYNVKNFGEIVGLLRPDVYVMGKEFAERDSAESEKKEIQKNGGRVLFSSGDVRYSAAEFLERDLFEIKEERLHLFKKALDRQKICVPKLHDVCNMFSRQKILVIGDTIVDQYVACDPVGMSSEAPVLVIKELESREFLGGAGVVARHIRAMGSQCHLLSLVGADQNSHFVRKSLKKDGITSDLCEDVLRPTTFKIRYMVGAQKVLRVSRLKETAIDRELENRFIQTLDEIAGEFDGVVVSDFNYGLITPRILSKISELSKKYSIKLFGDVQSSSQIGDISKFVGYHLLTPTEREARIAMQDNYGGLELLGTKLIKKAGARGLVLKLGENGFVVFERTSDEKFLKTQHFPALNPNPVDVMGAGDSLLSSLALGCCAGGGLMVASTIASVVASLATQKMGNIPIKFGELKSCLTQHDKDLL